MDNESVNHNNSPGLIFNCTATSPRLSSAPIQLVGILVSGCNGDFSQFHVGPLKLLHHRRRRPPTEIKKAIRFYFKMKF